jgi:hypothetical protein
LGLSILKVFSIREKAKTEFRAEAYNVWNHANFNDPAVGPASSAFGQITGTAGDARN